MGRISLFLVNEIQVIDIGFESRIYEKIWLQRLYMSSNSFHFAIKISPTESFISDIVELTKQTEKDRSISAAFSLQINAASKKVPHFVIAGSGGNFRSAF